MLAGILDGVGDQEKVVIGHILKKYILILLIRIQFTIKPLKNQLIK
jgi:hypothetical protein